MTPKKDKLVLYFRVRNPGHEDFITYDVSCYVLYDEENHKFKIHGVRNTEHNQSKPFIHSAKKIKHMIDFISVIIQKFHNLTVILYNYSETFSETFSEWAYRDLDDKSKYKLEITGHYDSIIGDDVTATNYINYIKTLLKNLKQMK